MKHIIVTHPNQLTVNWAQSIAAQHSPRSTVKKVTISSIDIGTTTRVRLEIDHNGPSSLPRRWFVKLPSLDWRARLITTLPRLLPTEIRYYQQISPTVAIKQPLLLAGHSHFGKGSTLVLGDISEQGALPGNINDSLTEYQAMSVIKNLANFHAQFWHKAHTNPEYRWLNNAIRSLEDKLGTILAVPLMKQGLKRAEQFIPTHLHIPALRYARNRKQAMHYLSSGSKTIVHHDCHPGNLFWHNGQPGLLDWQMVRIGEGIGDIAYFLATALTPKTRRDYEIELLACYQQTLADNGIHVGTDEMLHRYRAHLIYAFEAMVITLAIGGLMKIESNLELIHRTVAAIEDHSAFSTLPFPTE